MSIAVYGGGTPATYTHDLPNGAYTKSQLIEAIDDELESQNIYMTVGVCTMSTAPSEYVADEFTASFSYNASSGTYAYFSYSPGMAETVQSVFGGAGVHINGPAVACGSVRGGG